MTVYLLHLDKPLAHARHYTGFANRLDERLRHHANGTGARFTQVLRERGITWQLARVWEGASRAFERRLKNTKKVRVYCPICSGDAVREYITTERA